MNYKETVNYLFNSVPMFQKIGGQAYKEGLENTYALDKHFNHPHTTFKTIHVGGTNGKGSCSHTLAAILQSAGYKVGLYTSPHLVDFRERIRVNGEEISEEYVVNFVEEHKSFFEPLHPSFFELTTAMAFDYFRNEKVDVAIIEVGLGGRLDCTNIITPDLSIITNISFDHIQFLGATLAAIAKEKAGIIKPTTPIVIGERLEETEPIFIEKAKAMNAPIFFAEELYPELSIEIEETMHLDKPHPTSTHFMMKSEGKTLFEAFGALSGKCQEKNGRTIFTAAMQLIKLGYKISFDDIKQGIEKVIDLTHIMGRWQILQKSPTIICDTGHNKAGLTFIVEQLTKLQESHQFDNLHIVYGMMHDKDINGALSLLPKSATYYFTKADISRSLNEEVLREEAAHYSLHGDSYATVVEALQGAIAKSLPRDLIFVGGSSFVVADLLSHSNTFNFD